MVATCFLFTEHLNETNGLSLRLGKEGQLDAPLALRSIAEIQTLQEDAHTIVVAPTKISSLHSVSLPWLSERKARSAIPYALEEQLAQNVEALHFAFDRNHYQNGNYLISVIDKQRMADLINQLNELKLDFDVITLDWFALQDNEACITNHSLVINANSFKGELDGELAAAYLQNLIDPTSVYVFKNSMSTLTKPHFTQMDTDSHIWIAQRLLQSNIMNLCQGEFQQHNRQQTMQYWYVGTGFVAAFWLISIIAVNTFNLYFINKQLNNVNQKIGIIYHEFFPNARQVISPKFRISQLLKTKNMNQSEALWPLMEKLAQAFNNELAVEQLRFQNKTLSVTLSTKDFATLETLQGHLKEKGIHVAQTQASTQKDQVVATLELSL